MKTEEQIKEEIKKHREYLKNTSFKDRTIEQKMHSTIIEALEWVLGEKKMPDKLYKCYYWHIITLAKMKNNLKQFKRIERSEKV